MSYEGFDEYICPEGHYDAHDAHNPQPLRCGVCGQPFVWHHIVDQTNGIDEDIPSTFCGAKHRIDPEEIEKKDHRGNTYYVLRERWAPDKEGHHCGAGWTKLPTLEERRSWVGEDIATHERALAELKWAFRLRKNTLCIYAQLPENLSDPLAGPSYDPLVYFLSGRPLWYGVSPGTDTDEEIAALFALFAQVSAAHGGVEITSFQSPRKHQILAELEQLRGTLDKLK